jgi:predicted PurR-regulated permease PerM
MRATTNVTAAAPAGEPRLQRVLLVSGALIVLALAPYLSGLLGAVVLHVSLAPLHRRLARVMRPRAAALAVVLAATVVLLVPGTWLVSTTVDEATDALTALQRSDLLARLSRARVGGLDVGQEVASAGAGLLSWLSGRALALFGSATRATLNLMVALFGLYYLLLDAGALWRRVTRLLPVSEPVAEQLRERFVAVTEAMLLGTLLTAVIQGAVVGAGFALVGLRAPVLWGVVTACVSVLPVLGSALVWLPGVAVLLLAQRYGAAVVLGVLGAGVASNLDNVVRLVVYRRVSGIHPMLTLVGAFAGVGVFGLAGVLLGPLALSYFFELLALHEVVHRGPGQRAVAAVPAGRDDVPASPAPRAVRGPPT